MKKLDLVAYDKTEDKDMMFHAIVDSAEDGDMVRGPWVRHRGRCYENGRQNPVGPLAAKRELSIVVARPEP